MSNKICIIPNTDAISMSYINFVKSNGYSPFTIMTRNSNKMNKILKKLGRNKAINKDNTILLLTGGRDLDAPYFGYKDVACKDTLPIRDHLECKLLDFAIEREIPVIGICRGFQLAHLALLDSNQFTWWQHLNGHRQNKRRVEESHPLIMPSKELKKLFEREFIMVNSFHHQAIEPNAHSRDNHSRNLAVSEKSKFVSIPHAYGRSKEGIVFLEAGAIYENKPNGRMVFFGFQWHPEDLEENNDRLIKWAVDLIKESRFDGNLSIPFPPPAKTAKKEKGKKRDE